MGGSKKRGPAVDRARVLAQARGLVDAGRPGEAETLLRRGLPSPSKDAEGLRLRARIAEVEGRPADMKALAEKSLRIEPHPDGHLILAQFHLRHGDVDPARAEAARAVEVDPENANARLVHAAILLEAGRVDDAETTVAPLRDAPPADASLASRLGYTIAAIRTRRGEHQSALEHLDAEALTGDVAPPQRKAALALRAKILDHLGRYDEAMADAESFNALERVTFSPGHYDRDVDRMIERNGREQLERFPTGFQSDLPVLVSGMPRSGTSLVDRIIDAHPDAAGAGEFTGLERFAAKLQAATDPSKSPPACFGELQSPQWRDEGERYVEHLESMHPGVRRIVNKSLSNANLLGLASRLLPGARVIHVVRDPRDVAISCVMGEFRPAVMPWTTRLDWVATAWAAMERLMRHWHAVLDVPILDVRYERLVADPDTEFRRIIDFIDLPWHDACLEFHATGRPLRTLSNDQVCRPLYTSSVGRHRHYAAAIATVEWPAYQS
jgi:hypothetical protein